MPQREEFTAAIAEIKERNKTDTQAAVNRLLDLLSEHSGDLIPATPATGD